MWNPLRKLRLHRKLGTVANVGIDIGTSTIKILQLSATAEGENIALQTYGQLASYGHIRRFNDAIQTEGFRFFEDHVVRLLDTVLDRAGVTTRDVVFSIPIFSTFITTLRLPYMEPEEMASAIPLQARQYVPSPLEEVELTWIVTGYERGEQKDAANKEAKANGLALLSGEEAQNEEDLRFMRILLIAAPKDVIQQYVDVADQLDLNLNAIELESISLARAVVHEPMKPTLLIDIGARSTDVTFVDNGLVQLSHNVDVAGEELTKAFVRSGHQTFLEAERMKRDRGFATSEGVVHEEFAPVINQIVREIQRVGSEYQKMSGHVVKNIILSGGTSMLAGVDHFFSRAFPNATVIIGDPWRNIQHPNILQPVLNDLGPAYGVAVGLALRNLKKSKPVNVTEEISSVETLITENSSTTSKSPTGLAAITS